MKAVIGVVVKDNKLMIKKIKEKWNEVKIKWNLKMMKKILNKELSGNQLSKKYVESIIKMPYEEFENLDIEDQNKLIEEKTGRKLTFDDRLHIDGIPLDENHIKTIEQVDKQIDKIVHESSAKKLIRKFKKRD